MIAISDESVHKIQFELFFSMTRAIDVNFWCGKREIVEWVISRKHMKIELNNGFPMPSRTAENFPSVRALTRVLFYFRFSICVTVIVILYIS